MSTVAQFATGVESSYGSAVTPDRFYEVLEGESLERQQDVIITAGLRPSIFSPLGARRVVGRRWGGGQVTMEVMTSGFGRWFAHMLGGTAVTQGGTTVAYEHVYTPADLTGKSLTVQKGVQPVAGSAQPFTFHGVKIPEWELSIGVNGFAKLQVTLDAEDVDTSTGLVAASYGTLKPLPFTWAALVVDGTAVAGVSEVSIRGRNALNTDRWFLGSAGLKAEPLENGLRELGGQLTAEFADIADFYGLFAGDTKAQLILRFTGDTIEDSYKELLEVTLYDVRFIGDTPKIASPGFAVQQVPFEGFQDVAGSSIAVKYVTTDTKV